MMLFEPHILINFTVLYNLSSEKETMTHPAKIFLRALLQLLLFFVQQTLSVLRVEKHIRKLLYCDACY